MGDFCRLCLALRLLCEYVTKLLIVMAAMRMAAIMAAMSMTAMSSMALGDGDCCSLCRAGYLVATLLARKENRSSKRKRKGLKIGEIGTGDRTGGLPRTGDLPKLGFVSQQNAVAAENSTPQANEVCVASCESRSFPVFDIRQCENAYAFLRRHIVDQMRKN